MPAAREGGPALPTISRYSRPGTVEAGKELAGADAPQPCKLAPLTG